MEKILEVKNLKISFRTSSGTVKAVRDISFDLEKGRTLAIVGESGSGKSVTSKAILGILAGNSIVEGGEIIYDGKDLLKITEEDMCEIRGDEVSMIFQDPLSSLNPIVKIGKQITEAMLLKNKTSRKAARTQFNGLLALLQKNMIAADPANEGKIKEMIKTFDTFCIQANKLENRYNDSVGTAQALVSNMEDFLFRTGKKQKLDVKGTLKEYKSGLKSIKDPFFTAFYAEKLAAAAEKLDKAAGLWKKGMDVLPTELRTALESLKALLEEMAAQEKPDFFRIGFYSMKNPSEDLTKEPVAQLNARTLAYLDSNFMNEFIAAEVKGVSHSYQSAMDKKKAVMAKLAEAKTFFAGEFTKKQALAYTKTLANAV